MPTGYTAGVADGSVTDLRTFALQCARGMGALISMRDELMDAPIPEAFEPSPYAVKRLEELRAELAKVRAMTADEREEAAAAAYRTDLEAEAKWREEKRVVRNRYNAMIAQVVRWDCEADGLKELMLEQLHRGRDFDAPADEGFWKTPKRLSGQEWYKQEETRLYGQVARAAEEVEKEAQRVAGRNAWLTRLRRSLAAVGETGARDSGSGPEGEDAQAAEAESPQSGLSDSEGIAQTPPSNTRET